METLKQASPSSKMWIFTEPSWSSVHGIGSKCWKDCLPNASNDVDICVFKLGNFSLRLDGLSGSDHIDELTTVYTSPLVVVSLTAPENDTLTRAVLGTSWKEWYLMEKNQGWVPPTNYRRHKQWLTSADLVRTDTLHIQHHGHGQSIHQ